MLTVRCFILASRNKVWMSDFRGNREIGEEVIGVDRRVLIEKPELVEDVPVHENVAGAGGELELAIPHVDRLPDAVLEYRVLHRDLAALLFGVGAELTLEVAIPGRLNIQDVGRDRNKFPAGDPVQVDLDRGQHVPRRFEKDGRIHRYFRSKSARPTTGCGPSLKVNGWPAKRSGPTRAHLSGPDDPY